MQTISYLDAVEYIVSECDFDYEDIEISDPIEQMPDCFVHVAQMFKVRQSVLVKDVLERLKSKP